jgi:hypothetical protein
MSMALPCLIIIIQHGWRARAALDRACVHLLRLQVLVRKVVIGK